MADGAPAARPLGVVGAGTMGRGIATVAARAGLDVVVLEPSPAARERAAEKPARAGSVRVVDAAAGLAECGTVIEAAPEDLGLKRAIFAELAAVVAPDAVLATNTSSLSVEALAATVPDPSRFLGLHFFNPVKAMELVEVVVGGRTAADVVAHGEELARTLGKTPIRVADGIGFLANRCARPFTTEGLRCAAALGVRPARVDLACRLVGFPMGPFELIDLVGADVSLGVAESFFRQSFGEPRWRPHRTLVQMVAAGRLGRKTGAGFYDYDPASRRGPDPAGGGPGLLTDPRRLEELAGPEAVAVVGWISACLVNEGAFALEEGIAAEPDIDLAMRLGYRWPLGPLEIGRRLGFAAVHRRLVGMREDHGEAYRPAPRLAGLV
ncbi:MAG: 3-hydroxybutyryl-CoA dehydrogenase [Actinobacteria bacterium]|nr:3-hydroxybutyryl-CoA dehydrogenase [Actinomycetota bacterium]